MYINKLDVTLFDDSEIKYVSLGQFNKEIVDFIVSKKPEFFSRLETSNDILFWKARVKHTNDHDIIIA